MALKQKTLVNLINTRVKSGGQGRNWTADTGIFSPLVWFCKWLRISVLWMFMFYCVHYMCRGISNRK